MIGVREGRIRTARPLTPDQRAAVEKKFTELCGEPLALTEQVEPGLLGGICVEIGGYAWDGSLQTQLDVMRKRLLSGDAETRADDWISIGAVLRERLNVLEPAPTVRSAGEVLRAGDGIVSLSGLPECRLGELVEFEGGGYGIAMNLEEQSVGVVLLGEDAQVQAGQRAWGTGQVLSVPVGEGLLGRVVNPLGQPLDGGLPIHAEAFRPIESPAPGILVRQSVDTPLETGLVAVDAMVPIGRGQRELIIGDRQTGKTALALDAILAQKGKGIACFYVAIGQKASSVAQLLEVLRESGAMSYTCVICSTASDSATMQYIAPYCGCAMAEHFMYQGKDALIVYDDLTKHAVTYRALSLLLRRPPGREAFPGDVFYLHSRLLERAARLNREQGGGSMTALPIVETQAGDISAYIPTNVISITDGQLFLDTDLFRAGQRPAVNGGLSVSRVGGAAQTKAMRKVAGQLRLELAQYRELQVFARFSSDIDRSTQAILEYGEHLTELLKQRNHAPLPMPVQVAMLYALTRNLLPKDMTREAFHRWKTGFPDFLHTRCAHVVHALDDTGVLDDAAEAELREAVSLWFSLPQEAYA